MATIVSGDENAAPTMVNVALNQRAPLGEIKAAPRPTKRSYDEAFAQKKHGVKNVETDKQQPGDNASLQNFPSIRCRLGAFFGSKVDKVAAEENRGLADEAEPCMPASKKARIQALWRGAVSAVGVVGSSVSERAVATVSQVGGKVRTLPGYIQSSAQSAKVGDKLRALPSFIQSSTHSAKIVLKAAASYKILSRSLAPATAMQAVLGSVSSASNEVLEPLAQEIISDAVVMADNEKNATEAVEMQVTSEKDSLDSSAKLELDGVSSIDSIASHRVEMPFESSNAADPEAPLSYDSALMGDDAHMANSGGDEIAPQEVGFMEHNMSEHEQQIGQASLTEVGVDYNLVDAPLLSASDEFHGDQEVTFSEESFAIHDYQQADEVQSMPLLEDHSFDQSLEANQALNAGFAANQAADFELIVDSQGVEWYPVHDNQTGCVYYWNQRTGETTWTRPVTSAEAAFGA
mmetsp:Transcript_22216/g.35614  ORF Transcript_22216/g.35614 Transcript_22216/m.35614 type:complete len:462 (+) Transcript_22216:73-1458(+)